MTPEPGARSRPDRRRRAAAIATAASGGLIVLKIVLAVLTGSVAVLAEATHSAADLLAAVVASIAVRGEAREDDGGAAARLGAVEGALVLAAAVVIAVAALNGAGALAHPGIGALGMLLAGAAAGGAAKLVGDAARRTGSEALADDAAHLGVSTATSIGVAVMLALVKLTGLTLLDTITALAIAGVVGWGGLQLILAARPGRGRPTPAESEAVARAIARGAAEIVGYGRMRARQTGPLRRIDVDVTVRGDIPEARFREVWLQTQAEVADALPGARVVVHLLRPEIIP